MNKENILFAILVFIVLLFPIAISQEDIDWNTNDAWTTNNVNNADSTSIRSAIKDNPQLAQIYFESKGLQGGAGSAYIEYLTQGKVTFTGGNEFIRIVENRMSNKLGPYIDDITQFPLGTQIKPDGEDGFTIILPSDISESGTNEIIISGENVKSVSFKETEGLEPGSKNHNFEIITTDGRAIILDTNEAFAFDGKNLMMSQGTVVHSIGDGKLANTVILGETTMAFQEDGAYRIDGIFMHNFRADIGDVTVPSIGEFLALQGGILSEEAFTFCFKCNIDLASEDIDKAVIWNGRDLSGKGKIGLSIKKDNEIFYALGVANGVIYETNGKHLDIVSVPGTNELIGRILEQIETEKQDLRLLLGENSLEIEKLVEEGKLNKDALGSLSLPEDLSLKERRYSVSVLKTRDLLEGELNNYPKKVTQGSKKDLTDELYKGYKITDIVESDSIAELVVTTKIKENSLYSSIVEYDLSNRDFDLKVNRFNLVNPYSREEVASVDLSFRIDGKEQWALRDGLLYEENNQINFYTDTTLTIKEIPNGYSISGEGDITNLLKDSVGFFAGSVVEGSLTGKKLPFFNAQVMEDGTIKLSSEITDEIKAEINKEPEAEVGFFARIITSVTEMGYGEEGIADVFQIVVADEFKSQVEAGGEFLER